MDSALANLFRRLRGRLLTNSLAALFRTAKLRLATIVVCIAIIASVVFIGAWEGFGLLRYQNLPGTGLIVGLLFDFMFLTLGVMLVFSGGLILYGSLFASSETRFLLALPARADRIYAYKYQGAIGFSSWAFVLLGLPVLAAFGLVYSVAWPFWFTLPLFLIGFLLIPGSIGAIGCFLIVSFFPRRRKHVFIALAIGFVVVIGLAGYHFVHSALNTDVTDRDAITGLLGQLAFTRSAWAPSHWMTQGLQAAARGNLVGVSYPLALVWANGLMLYLVSAYASLHLYRRGINRVQTGGNLRKRYGAIWLDRVMEWVFCFLGRETRLLIVKDFRMFRRDTGQWAQVLIFVGLALTYFASSRQFYRSDLNRSFQHGVSLVNLLATCLLLCAYMGRFIYPMLSLEGRKFWILGLMPLKRRNLLWGKFAFALVGSLVIAVSLILTADILLGLPSFTIAIHTVVVVSISAGLSGVAVGIGALLPNFRETDPSKIAVGFGGTMNLLAGVLFLLLEIGLMACPHQLREIFDEAGPRENWSAAMETVAFMAGLFLAVVATWVPLRAGARALEKMEF